MSSSTLLATLAGALAFVLVPPAMAQDAPANFDSFSTACLGAPTFLLGETPPAVDTVPIMTPLCSCLVTEFAPLPQVDVDVLAADLGGQSTEATHAAHGAYAPLQEKAAAGLKTCFDSADVTAAMAAARAAMTTAPADPAAPAVVTPPVEGAAPAVQ